MIPITRQKPHVIHHGRLVCEAPGQAGSPTRPPLSIRTDQIILIIKRTGLDLDTSLLRPSKPSMAEDVDRREEWEIGAKFVSGARWLIELIVKHQPRVNFCHETSPTFTSLNLQHDISQSNTDTGRGPCQRFEWFIVLVPFCVVLMSPGHMWWLEEDHRRRPDLTLCFNSSDRPWVRREVLRVD